MEIGFVRDYAVARLGCSISGVHFTGDRWFLSMLFVACGVGVFVYSHFELLSSCLRLEFGLCMLISCNTLLHLRLSSCYLTCGLVVFTFWILNLVTISSLSLTCSCHIIIPQRPKLLPNLRPRSLQNHLLEICKIFTVTMGVLRHLHLTPLSAPGDSKHRLLSPSMISPPLPPSSNLDTPLISSSITPVFDLISLKLQSKGRHLTLIVGRDRNPKASSLSDAADESLLVIPASPTDSETAISTLQIALKALKKSSSAEEREWSEALQSAASDFEASARSPQSPRSPAFDIRSSNATSSTLSSPSSSTRQTLIRRSIRQNHVLYSSEGLTLLSMDTLFTFKRRLQILSYCTPHSSSLRQAYVTSCVGLLRQIIESYRGRPLMSGFFEKAYERIRFEEGMLFVVAKSYKYKYGMVGVYFPAAKVFGRQGELKTPIEPKQLQPRSHPQQSRQRTIQAQKSSQSARLQHSSPRNPTFQSPTDPESFYKSSSLAPPTTTTKTTEPTQHLSPASRSPHTRIPMTPHSASEITPITRGEWSFLMKPVLESALTSLQHSQPDAKQDCMLFYPEPVKDGVAERMGGGYGDLDPRNNVIMRQVPRLPSMMSTGSGRCDDSICFTVMFDGVGVA